MDYCDYANTTLRIMTSNHAIFTQYDWETVLLAMGEMNATEFYGETYPLVEDYCHEFGITSVFYETFLQKAVYQEGYSYQRCLKDMVNMLLEDNRYACEGIENIYPAIETCLKNGATFPQDKLFGRKYNESVSLEDETVDYKVRATLLDRFHKVMDVTQLTDWSAIEACHWEDQETPQNHDVNRFQHLKSLSTYLLATYPNPKDQPYECEEES